MGVKPAAYLGMAGVGIVVGAAYWLMRPQPPAETKPLRVAQNTPETASLEKPKPSKYQPDTSAPLLLLGTVQASAQATLTTMMPAKVVAVRVTQGATVRRGQILVQLDDTDFVAQERTAQAGISAAQSQVSKARTGQNAQKLKAGLDILTARRGLEQAQIKLRQADLGRSAARDDFASERKLAQENVAKAETGLAQASKILTSLEALAEVGGVSRNDLEGARTQVKLAGSDRDAAKTQLERLEAGKNGTPYKSALAEQDYEAAKAGVRQAQEGVDSVIKAKTSVISLAANDLQSALANLEQANAGLSRARDARKTLQLTAPIAGFVSKVDIKQDETAQPGMSLVTLISLDAPRVEALVSARQIAQLKVGQTADIRVDAQPDTTFPAVISDIARVTEADGRSVRVTFRFRSPNPAIRPGQTARITLYSPVH